MKTQAKKQNDEKSNKGKGEKMIKFLINTAIAVLHYTFVMMLLINAGYLNIAILLPIYIPIFAIVFIILISGKYIASHMILIGSEVGLCIEYFLNGGVQSAALIPSIVNLGVVLIFATIAIVLQLKYDKKHKKARRYNV